MAKVFLGVPTHDGRVGHYTVNALFGAGKSLAKSKIDIESAFVLCINRLWCEALNRRSEGITHFCLLHSDIEIHSQGWLDQMVDSMCRTEADILSVVVPLKDNRGLTSTGVETKDLTSPLEFKHRKLSLEEIARFKSQTFEAQLINTGVMLVDIRKDWVEQIWFEFQDRIEKTDDGLFYPVTLAEDWGFSRKARTLGARLFATTEIHVTHHGNWKWSNEVKK